MLPAGEIGADCSIDTDCPDNAICDSGSSVCVCSTGYSNVNNVCIEGICRLRGLICILTANKLIYLFIFKHNDILSFYCGIFV